MESQTVMFCWRNPSATSRFKQAIDAAPAPETTSRTSEIFFFTTRRPFSTAAVVIMAVPC
ncbi:hypothetical protein D3C78_1479320 [compost metagenome]